MEISTQTTVSNDLKFGNGSPNELPTLKNRGPLNKSGVIVFRLWITIMSISNLSEVQCRTIFRFEQHSLKMCGNAAMPRCRSTTETSHDVWKLYRHKPQLPLTSSFRGTKSVITDALATRKKEKWNKGNTIDCPSTLAVVSSIRLMSGLTRQWADYGRGIERGVGRGVGRGLGRGIRLAGR